jgi:MoxR-like ATPase
VHLKCLRGNILLDLKNTRNFGYIQQTDELDYLYEVIKNIEDGNCAGILLYGPPGTGKTLLAISLANSVNAPYYIIDGSPDLDRRDLEGNWELIEGETRFNNGPLTLAIRDANKEGISIIIINEINAIRESEQISFNSLLSENHINLISKGFEKHELGKKSKLIIIGTMNKGVVGINKLQEAFDDRFIVNLEIDYPIRKIEVNIATAFSGCKKIIAEIVVDSARQIRKQAIKDFSITKIFSTRLIVNFCLLITNMPTKFLKRNIENVIINKLGETSEEKKSIAMILDGKMFEKNLMSELSNQNEVDRILINMKSCISDYLKLYGEQRTLKKNGDIRWVFLKWLWINKRNAFQEYFKLSEKIQHHEIYKEKTGKDHIFRGNITLGYVRWLYRHREKELAEFMKQIFPVF